jgi:glucose/arabinose dehydrogenase
MFKKFSLIVLAAVFAIALAGCSDSSSSKTKPPTQPSAEMVTLSTNVTTAVAYAMVEVQVAAMSPKKGISKAIQNIEYDDCGGGWCATGSMSYNDNAPYYPMTMDFDVEWDNYISSNGVVLESGTCGYVMDMTSQTQFSYDYTGDFVVTYQGDTYDFGWDMSIDYSTSGYSYTGTFTVDSVTYTYTASGK